MTVPEEFRYTREHEWIMILEGGQGRVGITEHAQDELGDVVFVDLSGVGNKLDRGKTFGIVESVKAVSDLYSPVSGTVSNVNKILEERPEIINEDPYGEGWMIEVQLDNVSELERLMSAQEYNEYLAEESSL